jgi:hypothetical protein
MTASPQPSVMARSAGSVTDYLPLVFFLSFGLIFISLRQSDFFHAIPGDLGDARFNNLILEHLYRWITGKDRSLWSPGFFYPYQGTLSFSDNHLGTFLIYALLRALGFSPEYAFVGWYTAAAPLNYLCCYYALRKYGLTAKGSAAGAFIFAFALTAIAQYQHAQLNYRFAIPLAMLSWQQLIDSSHVRHLTATAFWVTVQFYCSIYLGYFLLLLLGASFIALYLVRHTNDVTRRPHQVLLNIAKSPRTELARNFLAILGCAIALVALLHPYLHYSKLYGFQGDPAEISTMLPRPWSYLLADNSGIWGALSVKLPSIPMRHEHQMFFGLAAAVLATIGSIRNTCRWTNNALISLALLVLITLYVHGHSFYIALQYLPGAGAIRAVSRIGAVMLFPIGLLAGNGYDWLSDSCKQTFTPSKSIACALLTLLMLAEYATLASTRVPITEWRNRLSMLKKQVPENLAKNAIIFVPPQRDTPLFMTELDGMSLAQALDRNTLNGYSGKIPNDFYFPNTNPCEQATNRIAGYVRFTHQSESKFDDLLGRIIVAGARQQCTHMALSPS